MSGDAGLTPHKQLPTIALKKMVYLNSAYCMRGCKYPAGQPSKVDTIKNVFFSSKDFHFNIFMFSSSSISLVAKCTAYGSNAVNLVAMCKVFSSSFISLVVMFRVFSSITVSLVAMYNVFSSNYISLVVCQRCSASALSV